MYVARKLEWRGEIVKTTQLLFNKPSERNSGWAHVFAGVIQGQIYAFVNKHSSERQ
jgi:hypothetical protein